MTKEEFALKIKEKYPAYKNQDNDILVGKVLQKYPEYSSQVDQQPHNGLQAVSNLYNKTLGPSLNPVLGAASQIGNTALGAGAQLGQGLAGGLQSLAEGAANYRGGSAIGVPALMAKEMVPQTKTDVALTAIGGEAVDAGLQLAGKGVVRAGEAVLPRLSSVLTSIESPLVDRAIARSSQVGLKLKQILNTDLKFITDSAVKKLDEAIVTQRTVLGKKFRAVTDAIADKVSLRVPHPKDIAEDLKLELSNAGYKVSGFQNPNATRNLPDSINGVLKEFEKVEGKEAPSVSKIVNAQGQPIINPGSPGNLKDVPFRRAYNVRKVIDDVVQWGDKHPLYVGKDVDAILKNARTKLNERLYTVSPEFQAVSQEFSKMAKVYEFLQKRVLNGPEDQVANRVSRLMKKGSVQRAVLDKLDGMGAQTMDRFNTLLDTITAGRYAPGIHPSAMRAAMNTGGGMLTAATRFMNHSPEAIGTGAAVTGALTAASSPRLNFRVIQASKQIAKILSSLGLGSTSKIAASLSAPSIHDAIVDHITDQHLQNASSTP